MPSWPMAGFQAQWPVKGTLWDPVLSLGGWPAVEWGRVGTKSRGPFHDNPSGVQVTPCLITAGWRSWNRVPWGSL